MSCAQSVRVANIRKVYADANHNAFTDLCRFGERLYLSFRSCPDGHAVNATASIVVLASDDAQTWQEVHRFRVAERDTRDPHFLVFNKALFVYTGTWLCDPGNPEARDLNDHLGYAAWSSDGRLWQGPKLLEGTYGHYIWRAAAYQGKAYLCGRRKRGFARTEDSGDGTRLTESALLESEDGFTWRTLSLFQEEFGDETAFLFESDGSILAVARSGGARPAQVCRARAPYREWARTDLDRHVGGPLLASWGGKTVVGGRKTENGQPTTTLYWLIDDQLVQFAELPSGGDTSYPGLVETGPDRALLSYYSSHEEAGAGGTAQTSIYLADLSLA